MLFGIYSLLSATAFLVMAAVDVAFTEAAVGAGVSSLLVLATLAQTDRWEQSAPSGRAPRLLLVAVTGAALVWGTMDAPAFGDPDAPSQQHVAPRYIDRSPAEIGIPNMVTSVLASYRGYDTLGEVAVIFTAGLGAVMLIGRRRRHRISPPPPDHPVLRVTSKILIPPIMLFGLYVLFHGEISPGGGFQAGVIFAAALILYALVFGVERARSMLPAGLLRGVAVAGLLLFGLVGLSSIALDGAYLEYRVLGDSPVAGQQLGIMLIELGVGMLVAAVMTKLFFVFAERGA